MLKFATTLPQGGELYGFGLSFRNLELLKEGRPIRIDLSTLGGEGYVLIFAGETEQAMADQLVDAGLIGPETEIKRG